MATLASRLYNLVRPGSLPKASPMKEVGVGGTAVFGGIVQSREKSAKATGLQRWQTFAEIVTNTSIVAAGVRYFLNVVASSQWSVKPVDDDNKEAVEIAEFVEKVINDMDTPWKRVARRAAMYRFNGYGVQEWWAKRRDDDGKIGLANIEARPNHTMERWELDDSGTVTGIWQRSPQTSELIFLPRKKLLYLVEDSLTDSPEGLGLLRHMMEPYQRLQKYLELEGRGFERDLRGIPIGRVPYGALKAAIDAGQITEEKAKQVTNAIESFVKMQSKSEDTSIVLDSAPYTVETDSGKSISGVMQYGLELLQGQTPGFAELDNAISRLNREMARIIGAEHLLLGEAGGSANRSLSEDKSRNFYLTANSTMDEIADAANQDVIQAICDLNGIKKELRPKLTHSDVSFRTVAEITASLRDMATAGAVLAPNDPAIDDVRDMLGLKRPPELDQKQMGLMGIGGTEDQPHLGGTPGVDPKEQHDKQMEQQQANAEARIEAMRAGAQNNPDNAKDQEDEKPAKKPVKKVEEDDQ